MLTRWILAKRLLAIGMGVGLLSVPAWGHSIASGAAGGTKKAEKRAASIRPATTTAADHGNLHGLLNSLTANDQGKHLGKHLYAPSTAPKSVRFDETPPKNVSWPSWPGWSDLPQRGHRNGKDTPAPIPEPSALLFFGAGLLLARGAIGRGRPDMSAA